MLALLANIALIRLPPDSQWRTYPYNWQYCAGLLVAAAGVCGTVFVNLLTDEAHRAAGAYCSGLYGWLTVVFAVSIVVAVAAAGLGVWYSVRMLRS